LAADGQIALTTVGLSQARATTLLVGNKGETKSEGDRARVTIPSGGRRSMTILVANPVARGKELTEGAALAEARAVLEKAHAVGVDALRRQRKAYWHSFWSKTDVVMHSDDGVADYIENLYHLFLYWMAGSSRGSDAPKFNGSNYIFGNDWRAWGGQYWYQNTREMYWSLLPADHGELLEPFVDLYWRHLPAARALARDTYDAPGACYEETFNGFDGGGDKRGNPYTQLYLTTGTEIAHQIYQSYLYTCDETFLREKAYTLMKETVSYHLHFLNKEADGLYHVYPSNARETYWFIKDSVTDLVALRTVLPILIRESQRLGVDAEERARWQDVLDHLAPYVEDQGKGVLLPGTFLDEFPPTRFPKAEAAYPADKRTTKSRGNAFNCENVACEPIYPWGLVGLDSPPAELEKLRRTFRARPHYEWTLGNSWDPSVIWAARLGMADELLRCIKMFAQNVQTYPSGMAGTPGTVPEVWGKVINDTPAFDSAGVIAAVVLEMNLQSYHGRLRVFPCVPRGWESEFTLAAEGGFLVSSKITKDGTIPFIKILSRHGGPCTVVNPWNDMTNAVFSLETKPGQTYELRPERKPPSAPPIQTVRNNGPKWPFHNGPDDTAAAYLQRPGTQFGFIGIANDGGNPARNMVRQATAVDTYPSPARTLFQARFNDGLDATGAKAHATGARITDGAADIGYGGDTSATLWYDAAGHVDSRQGTIEFWVKTAWDWDSRTVPPHPSLICIPLGLEPGRSLNVYAYMHDGTGPAYIGFYITDGQKQASVSLRVGPDLWKKDEWHHVAATWNEWRVQLFLDGKLIERKFVPDRLDLSAPPQKIFVGCSPNAGISPNPNKASGVLIDDLRILDQPVNEIVPNQREQP